MQLGVRRGIGRGSLVYQPILTTDGINPVNFGTGTISFNVNQVQAGARGFYSIVGSVDGSRLCIGHADFVWGAGGNGNGGGPDGSYSMSLPVPIRACEDTASGDYFIGAGMWGQVLGQRDSPMSVYAVGQTAPSSQGGITAPAWAHGIVGPSETTGTATIASASSSIVVSHGMGATPDAVTFNPTGSPSASGLDMNHCWVDTIGATQFTIHGQTSAAGNLTASRAFGWVAVRTGAVVLQSNTPVLFGSNADHIEIFFAYPIDG